MDAKTRGLLLLAVLSLVCAYFALAGGRGLFATVFFALSVTSRSRCNPEALALKTRPSLILKPAPIGWNQEHYDVLEDGVVEGRIFLMPIGPRGRLWMSAKRPQWR
jgi:hypothetical protein